MMPLNINGLNNTMNKGKVKKLRIIYYFNNLFFIISLNMFCFALVSEGILICGGDLNIALNHSTITEKSSTGSLKILRLLLLLLTTAFTVLKNNHENRKWA